MNMRFFPGFIVVAWIALGISFIECNNIGKTAAEHERDILDICIAEPLRNWRDYTSCIKREWDRIHEEENDG